MARLNTRLSATPLYTRSSTVDSLYRDPSLAPRHDSNSNVRTSPYSVLSPTQSISSDKENEQPGTRQNTPQMTKSRGQRGGAARIPTPDSGSLPGSHGNKRRRTGDYNMSESETHLDDPEEEDQEEENDDENDSEESPSRAGAEEEGDLRFYNPNQDPNQRRRLRASMRDHQRNVDDNRDEMVKANSKLLDALKTQNNLFGKVRQTADAALDSRFLVNASDLAGKKLNNSLQGNADISIDIDQFVSKCIYFMKSGGHTASEEDAPAIPVVDEEEEDGDGLDWALLGRQACFPSNRRPPTSSFLLGPLSVQKRARTTQRKARSQRQPVGPATRPQEIREGDIQQSENSNLSALVKSINVRLKSHLETVDLKVSEELEEIPEDEVEEEDLVAASKRHRAALTPTKELAVNLLDFAINPRDFGQTVENLFYISFLVREGAASIMKDEDGLPLLMPAKAREIHEQREKNAQKHQAIFSLDYSTWQMFIEAFNIEEPLIPHREPEESNVGSGGWYAG